MENKKKILIVDDDPQILRALSDHLSRENYEVVTATDGEDGLKKAREEHPDLLLVDIIMPKLDGISMLKAIKQDVELANIPAIILTNLQTDEGVARAVDAGSTVYLVKIDYSLEELSRVIRENLKR